MNQNQQNQQNSVLSVLDILNVIGVMLQWQNMVELHSQSSTDEIMNELQAQDRRFLSSILEGQKTIDAKLDLILGKLNTKQLSSEK